MLIEEPTSEFINLFSSSLGASWSSPLNAPFPLVDAVESSKVPYPSHPHPYQPHILVRRIYFRESRFWSWWMNVWMDGAIYFVFLAVNHSIRRNSPSHTPDKVRISSWTPFISLTNTILPVRRYSLISILSAVSGRSFMLTLFNLNLCRFDNSSYSTYLHSTHSNLPACSSDVIFRIGRWLDASTWLDSG